MRGSAARSRRGSRCWRDRASPDPLITVTWNAKDETTQIRTARSRDGGRTFVDEMNLQTKGAIGDRGWQASTIDSRGTLHTIWLDHRAMAASKAAGDHSEHKGEHDGVAMAQKSGLYYAADGVPERELFKGVCYCCKTAMATGPKGEIYAAWRHVFAGNMRDMGFTMSRDGGKTFAPLTRVNEDGWSIQGCPDDGPGDGRRCEGHRAPRMANGEERAGRHPVRDVERTAPLSRRRSGCRPWVARSRRIRRCRSTRPAACSWHRDEVRDGVRRAAIAPISGSKSPEILEPDVVSGDGRNRHRPGRRMDVGPAGSADRRARHTVTTSYTIGQIIATS